MIRINLLPHREEARKRRRERFYVLLAASVVFGGLVAAGVYGWYQFQISAQRARNAVLQAEIKRLEVQIKDVAALQDEIAALRARQQAVEDLQADRNMPVHLLNELVSRLPDGVYLTSMRQTNQLVVLQGVAQSNERVSELLRNLSSVSPWLTRPELVEIVAANSNLSQREQRRVSNFTMRVQLVRAGEARAASSAASGAASAASAKRG